MDHRPQLGHSEDREHGSCPEPVAILQYDRDLGRTWARVVESCRQQGRTIADPDAWIAATACRHGIPLVTHNLKHFYDAERLCGLKLLRIES